MKTLLACCLVIVATDALAAEPETIPLDEIWAYEMPGTKDIRELEPQFFGDPIRTEAQVKQAGRSLASQILRPLSKPAHKRPKSAFSVKGIGLAALNNAHSVLAKNEEPANVFASGDDVTAVFFSRISGTYVHINRVSRQRDRIEIRYEFVPHIDAELTFHLALILMGKLPPGEYKTRIVLSPLDKKHTALADESALKELASRSVCKSFQFVVRDRDQGE